MNEFREIVVRAELKSIARLCHLVDEFSGAGAASLPVILDALKYEHAEVRACAARALGRIEDGRPEVVSALTIAVGDDALIVRQSAAAALGVIEPLSTAAVTALQQALADNDQYVRAFAAMALDSYAQGQGTVIAQAG